MRAFALTLVLATTAVTSFSPRTLLPGAGTARVQRRRGAASMPPTAMLPDADVLGLAADGSAALHTTLSLAADSDAWSSYLALLEDPQTALATKAVTAGLIIGSGDAAAQLIETRESGDDVDAARVARWAFFGFILQAPWNHFFYMALDGAIPPTPEPFTVVTLEKVGIDQFVQAPVFTALIFVFFAVIEGKGLDYAKNQLQTTLVPTLLKNWAVFLPATFVNLAFLPNELRVLFLNSVFFFWVIYLSLTVNAAPTAAEE